MHAVSQLASRVYIHIEDNCIRTQAVDSSKSCMVTARVSCDVSGSAAEGVCLDALTLLRTLRSVGATQSVQLCKDGDTVAVIAVDDLTFACNMRWELPALVDDGFSVQLDSLEYDGEWVYDTVTLKHDLRRCKEMDGDGVMVLQLMRGENNISCVQITAEGDRGSVVVQHLSRTTDDGEEQCETPLDAAPKIDDMTVVFSQRYSMHSLMAFLKCVELPTVKLLVGNGQPLMLETALAAADSKMTFVQGPQM